MSCRRMGDRSSVYQHIIGILNISKSTPFCVHITGAQGKTFILHFKMYIITYQANSICMHIKWNIVVTKQMAKCVYL